MTEPAIDLPLKVVSFEAVLIGNTFKLGLPWTNERNNQIHQKIVLGNPIPADSWCIIKYLDSVLR